MYIQGLCKYLNEYVMEERVVEWWGRMRYVAIVPI